jgi:hypothetical protein
MNGSDYIEMEENKEPEMELKRCPFCGTIPDIIVEQNDLSHAYCPSCGSRKLISIWTDRPIEDELNARIKELEELLKWANGNLKPGDL